MRENYDVVVAGGGPAGAAAATLVAAAGHRVLVLERDPEPRFKVGESLMPATYDTFARLGVLERLRASRFPKKHSVQFYSPRGEAGMPFYFFERDPGERSQTWQVLRREIEQKHLDRAAEVGAEVRRGVGVREVLFAGGRAVGVVAEPAGGGAAVEIAARVVVDASGQRALVARQLGLVEVEPCLRNASLFTHFDGARRDAGVDEGATLILHTRDKASWFWFIPLPGELASVGVVGPVETLIRGRAGDPQQVFGQELARCPALAARLDGARQVRPVAAIRDFSYRARQAAGDGWVLAGDAGGFIDPIYSTGVFLALKSGEMAADAVVDGLAAGDLSGARLGRFAPELGRGVEALRRLVYAFYDRRFSFGRFVERFPALRPVLVDMLMGEVFSRPTDELLAALAAMVDGAPPAAGVAERGRLEELRAASGE